MGSGSCPQGPKIWPWRLGRLGLGLWKNWRNEHLRKLDVKLKVYMGYYRTIHLPNILDLRKKYDIWDIWRTIYIYIWYMLYIYMIYAIYTWYILYIYDIYCVNIYIYIYIYIWYLLYTSYYIYYIYICYIYYILLHILYTLQKIPLLPGWADIHRLGLSKS